MKDNKINATAVNEEIQRKDPTAHAEILAIQKAAKFLKTPDLEGCELYVSE